MESRDAIACLETIETELLAVIQNLRAARIELNKVRELSPTLEGLLDADAVAKLLGVETAYLYGLARAGKIPSLKFGKYRRFSPSRVKKWLERKATA